MATENTQDVNNITAEEEQSKSEPKLEPPKTKNLKRVEQGKRLAEWNRKNKQKLLTKVSEQNESIENVLPKNNNINYWVLGGTIVVGGLVVGVLYFTQRGAQVEASLPTRQVQVHTPSESKPQADDFDMA